MFRQASLTQRRVSWSLATRTAVRSEVEDGSLYTLTLPHPCLLVNERYLVLR
jgi:hypothetical protein